MAKIIQRQPRLGNGYQFGAGVTAGEFLECLGFWNNDRQLGQQFTPDVFGIHLWHAYSKTPFRLQNDGQSTPASAAKISNLQTCGGFT